MGSIHNELRSSALQQAIRDAVGGTMDVEIERVGETLTPVLDIWTQPEWFQLRSVRRFAISVPLAANVAGIARFQISNPAGSNIICVIEELNVVEQTAGPTNYLITDTGAFIAGGLAPCSALDTRFPIAGGGGSRPTVTQQTVDNTAAGNSGIQLDLIVAPLNVATRFTTALPFVLTPNNYIQVQSGPVNHQARFQVRGYERLAFPGEL